MVTRGASWQDYVTSVDLYKSVGLAYLDNSASILWTINRIANDNDCAHDMTWTERAYDGDESFVSAVAIAETRGHRSTGGPVSDGGCRIWTQRQTWNTVGSLWSACRGCSQSAAELRTFIRLFITPVYVHVCVFIVCQYIHTQLNFESKYVFAQQ